MKSVVNGLFSKKIFVGHLLRFYGLKSKINTKIKYFQIFLLRDFYWKRRYLISSCQWFPLLFRSQFVYFHCKKELGINCRNDLFYPDSLRNVNERGRRVNFFAGSLASPVTKTLYQEKHYGYHKPLLTKRVVEHFVKVNVIFVSQL